MAAFHHHRALPCSGEEDPGLVFLGEDVDLHELLRGAVLEDLPPEAARLLKVNRVTLLVIPVVRRRHAPLQVSKLLLWENPSKNVVLKSEKSNQQKESEFSCVARPENAAEAEAQWRRD